MKTINQEFFEIIKSTINMREKKKIVSIFIPLLLFGFEVH